MKGLARTHEAPAGVLGDLDIQAITSMLAAASDIVLTLDETGVIRDIALGPTDAPLDESRQWLGQSWAETVTAESSEKVVELMREVRAAGVSRRQQLNHPSVSGHDIPIAYTVLRLGLGVLAIGRDLRAFSALQQRLVEAQQSLERDYWRMRHIETRYRLLFQVSIEAVLLVDASTQKVIEANPAALALFDQGARKLVGRHFPFDLSRADEALVSDQLVTVRAHGRADDVTVQVGERPAKVAVSLVRHDTTSLYLVRFVAGPNVGPAPAATAGANGDLLQALPDGFVATDREGRITLANRAFLDQVQLPTDDQVRGQPLGRWLGRPGADAGLLLATLREHGVVRLFGTSLRGELGSTSEVEVSAAAVVGAEGNVLGFSIRDVGRRLALGPRGAHDLTRAVGELTALVGKVSLKNLVRDTTDLVERHFIEAALEATADNRTSAAEVLGVSRQSLYVKLRRYNLGVLPPPAGPKPEPTPRTPRGAKKKRRKRN